MSRLLLVRHGRPEIDAARPASTWDLTSTARVDIEVLSSLLQVLTSPRVITSCEAKAIQTGEALGLAPVEPDPAFNEVAKPWYEDPSEQRAATMSYLQGVSLFGWEPLDDAVRRFDASLPRPTGVNDVVAVTHGTVMTAWLAAKNCLGDPYDFWSTMQLPDAWEVDLATRTVLHLGQHS